MFVFCFLPFDLSVLYQFDYFKKVKKEEKAFLMNFSLTESLMSYCKLCVRS